MTQVSNRGNTLHSVEQVQVGERIRNLRIALNISVRSLASKAGFSPSFISQVENGQVSPSIASLERIASVLGVNLAGFFTVPQPWVDISRCHNRQKLTSSWSHAIVEALTPTGTDRHLEAVMITLKSGGRSGKHASSHQGEEFAMVLEGEASLTLGEDIHILREGDTASFSAETPHLWENSGLEDTQVVIVSPRFTH